MKLQKQKIIYVDIDGTICENRDDVRNNGNPDATYEDCSPYHDRIRVINEIYDDGHEIHYWTARGVFTGTDWTELTKQQLLRWGAKYHELHVGGKPHFDMYICDKSYNAATFFHRKERQLP